MRLTYLAHASILVDSGGVRLVTDPWLDGPTYLSAWWHFPEPAARGADLRGVDFVYLTHEHVDHFHEPTLRALDRTTPILIGKFMRPRFRDKLAALGFTDVRELPHGKAVPLAPGFTVASYQSRADDTALVIRDGSATVLNLNDSLLRGRALEQVLGDFPRVDLLAASFANAEGYPIIYEFDDPAERIDWDDRGRFDELLEKVRQIAPSAFVPFASMFCFLSDELAGLNQKIVSPAALIQRARAGEVPAAPLPMNPGDRWSPDRGHEVVSDVDWGRKAELLEEYRRRRAPEVAALAARETVDGGRAALAAAFRAFFDGFWSRVPLPLRRKLDLTLRFTVDGPAGQIFWLRFGGGKMGQEPPASDDAWDAAIAIRDWPLWRALTRADTWQSLGISCRYRVRLRPSVREREVIFWFLLYLDDLGYLSPLRLLTPRAVAVAARRRRELGAYAMSFLRGTFVKQEMRGKFEAT